VAHTIYAEAAPSDLRVAGVLPRPRRRPSAMSSWRAVSNFRPLSARGSEDPRFDTLHEGFPPWLQEPVFDWLNSLLHGKDGAGRTQVKAWVLKDMQVRLRFQSPLDWSYDYLARADLFDRMVRYSDLPLDVLDYVVFHIAEIERSRSDPERTVAVLNRLLREGGSAWEATPVVAEKPSWILTHRQLGPVAQAVQEVGSSSGRAGEHLTTAWVKLASRTPDPSAAYREAVRAVEAASKPVVLPNDSLSTLGKVISALRQKPSKWTFELGSVELIADMCDSIWTSQLDRHGTDDATVPLSVTQEQADAAVHMALVLTRYFTGGAVRAV